MHRVLRIEIGQSSSRIQSTDSYCCGNQWLDMDQSTDWAIE
jgi:hypothetical protein